MSSFEQTRQKIKWNFTNSQINLNNVNNLKDYRIKFDSSNFNKKFTKYTLKENIELLSPLYGSEPDTWTPHYISFDLQNFTDAFIKSCKVVSVLRLEDGFELSPDYGLFYSNGAPFINFATDGTVNVLHQFNYWFTKIAENNYKLQSFLDIYAVRKNPDGTTTYVPVYWNLYLYTYNPHNWKTIQTNKT